jgi:hypothetical protein
MARKHRFRFGLPIVFAGRPFCRRGRPWLPANSVRCGRPGSARPAVVGLTADCRIQKARGGFSGAGSILATMKICQ